MTAIRSKAQPSLEAVTLLDKSAFISSLREVIEKDVLSADKTLRLIEAVKGGRMALPEVYWLVNRLLQG